MQQLRLEEDGRGQLSLGERAGVMAKEAERGDVRARGLSSEEGEGRLERKKLI